MSSNSQHNWPPMNGGGGGGAVTSVNGLTGAVVLTTTNIAEGTRLYYTQARFDTAFAAKTTTDLAEGSNLYFTAERVDDRVAALIQNGTGIAWTYNDAGNTLTGNVSLAAFTTTDLAEGTNLYYTAARFNTAFAAKSTTDLAEGTNLYYTAARFNTAFAAKSTTDLAEGSNLYFTDERAQDAVGTIVSGPLFYVDGTPEIGIDLADTTTDGYLSSTDWDTFNNKLSAATVASVSSNISLVNNFIYLVDTSSARTLTLPSPVTGIRIVIKDKTGSASTNPIALTPFGAEQIDTVAAAFPLNYNLGSWEVVSDGTNWFLT